MEVEVSVVVDLYAKKERFLMLYEFRTSIKGISFLFLGDKHELL